MEFLIVQVFNTRKIYPGCPISYLWKYIVFRLVNSKVGNFDLSNVLKSVYQL